MPLDKLFEEYGKASIALEVAQGQYNLARKVLVEALKKEEEEEVKNAQVSDDKTRA